MTNIPDKVQRIVIAGGGTAGWMTAAALSHTLGKQLNITLVESDTIGTVGVGEATIPTLQYFHRLLGIDEREFMAATQATFKLGIEFVNWRHAEHKYLHAFGHTGQDCWACGFQHFWLRGRQLGIHYDYGDYCPEHQAAKAERFAHTQPKNLNYAYHLDAGNYARYLRRFSEQRGVKRIEGIISDVALNPATGNIDSLTLSQGEIVHGDLFIDCTGFRGRLIEQALHTGYEDWSHWLPCDRAIAVQSEHSHPPLPFTRSTAQPYGWQWRIPLTGRQGNGVVFASNAISHADAEEQLLASLQTEPLTEPKMISFRTGKRRKQWHKNCVAIGLSSGFLEPLESTSIHLISSAILRLLDFFPHNGIQPSDIHEYNKQAELELIGIRDFVILHYKVTQRRDSPLWQYCQQMTVPDTLQEKLDLFAQTGRVLKERNELFEDSWQQVMLGQGLQPGGYHPIVNNMSDDELTRFLSQIRQQIANRVAQLPHHLDYLGQYVNQ
ncbi:MAG: tryptophan 7-halogenase [Gammaproteobacteria bacterium]|nr:tryptophan 7-halogenase [Gammaproteobacteria bacterium]